MTERVCKTCCWWNDSAVDNPGFGQCELEPVSIIKIETSRCRHHSFTTGWLEVDDYPSNPPMPAPGVPTASVTLHAKVKALSERCKEAREIIETLRGVETTAVSVKDMRTWLAGDDE